MYLLLTSNITKIKYIYLYIFIYRLIVELNSTNSQEVTVRVQQDTRRMENMQRAGQEEAGLRWAFLLDEPVSHAFPSLRRHKLQSLLHTKDL